MGMPTPLDRHPLAPLSDAEFRSARDTVLAAHGHHPSALLFRSIQLEEPPKKELVPYLVAEHAGELSETTPRPPRLARVQYDVVTAREDGEGSLYQYTQSVVDLGARKELSKEVAPDNCHPAFVMYVPDLKEDIPRRGRPLVQTCLTPT